MSWLRIEGRMPQHHKVAPLSDAAFRLHVTAMAWSVEGKTDGKIPFLIPQTLTRAPSGKKLREIVDELVRMGLWIEGSDAYQIHDFLQWNLSASEIAARSEMKSRAGAAGGRRSGEARAKQVPSRTEAPASPVLGAAAKTPEAESKPKSQSIPSRDPGSPTTTIQDLTGHGDECASDGGGCGSEPRIPCPADLQLTEQQAAMLESSLFSRDRQAQATQRFVLAEAANPAKTMTLTQWRKCLSMACSAALNNRDVDRPRGPRQQAQAPRQPDSGYRPSQHATELK